MKYTKKILAVFIVLVLLTDTAWADYQVTLYPGIKYLNTNPSNSDIFIKDLKTGKNGLLYTPEKIRNRVKHQLIYYTAIETSTKKDTNYISEISKIQKKLQKIGDSVKNNVDPFYLLAEMFANFANFGNDKEKNKAISNLKSVISSYVGTMIDRIAAALKTSDNASSKAVLVNIVILPIINNTIKEIANRSADILNINVSKSPVYAYCMSKLGDAMVILGTVAINIYKNKAFTNALGSDSVKLLFKESLKGGLKASAGKIILGYIAVIPALVEGAVNILNSVNIVVAMSATMQATKKMLYKELLLDFIRDYTLKYNMNIVNMANDSVYAKKHPNDFLEIFIYYLMTHNAKGKVAFKDSYISNAEVIDSSSSSYSVGALMYNLISLGKSRDIKINLNSKDDIKDLTKLARLTLTLIEKYGDGGNNKIFLTYKDKKEKVGLQINSNSYKTIRLYWMPEKDFYYPSYTNSDEWLFKYYDNIATPYTVQDNDWKTRSVLESSDHINIEYKDVTYVMNGKYLELNNFKKVINYNGFMGKNYSKYSKIVTSFPLIYIPDYNLAKYSFSNNKVGKYIGKLFLWDIIPIEYLFSSDKELKKYLYKPITMTDVFRIFKKFENNVHYSHTDLNTAYLNTLKSSNSLLTRKVLFKFLDEYLKLSSKMLTKNYVVQNLIFKKINTTDWTKEGFDLALDGIISFRSKMNPNNKVTMSTMLFILMNIENHLRTQK